MQSQSQSGPGTICAEQPLTYEQRERERELLRMFTRRKAGGWTLKGGRERERRGVGEGETEQSERDQREEAGGEGENLP